MNDRPFGRISPAAGLAVVLGAALAAQVPAAPESRTIGLPAALEAVPVPDGRQVFYSWDDVPAATVAPGQVRKFILGDTVTLVLNEFDPDAYRAAEGPITHRHTIEQIVFGLRGRLDWSIDGRRQTTNANGLALAGPDVLHAILGVPGPGRALALEFMNGRRTDLLPDGPKAPAMAPEPRGVPEGQTVFASFDDRPWIGEEDGHRFKAVFGEASTLQMWRLDPARMAGTSAPGHHHDVEQITVIVEGHAMMRVGDETRPVGPGTVLMIPSNVDHLGVSPVNGEAVVLLDFQPIVRTDLKERMR